MIAKHFHLKCIQFDQAFLVTLSGHSIHDLHSIHHCRLRASIRRTPFLFFQRHHLTGEPIYTLQYINLKKIINTGDAFRGSLLMSMPEILIWLHPLMPGLELSR